VQEDRRLRIIEVIKDLKAIKTLNVGKIKGFIKRIKSNKQHLRSFLIARIESIYI
jgi:hypothetical protein